jgi:hypothetical protein
LASTKQIRPIMSFPQVLIIFWKSGIEEMGKPQWQLPIKEDRQQDKKLSASQDLKSSALFC